MKSGEKTPGRMGIQKLPENQPQAKTPGEKAPNQEILQKEKGRTKKDRAEKNPRPLPCLQLILLLWHYQHTQDQSPQEGHGQSL